MPSLENNLTQAIWWLIILAGSYSSLERSINRLCHGFAIFDRLKER